MTVYEVCRSNCQMAQFTRMTAALNWALDHVQGPKMAPYESIIRDDASVIYHNDERWAYLRIMGADAWRK